MSELNEKRATTTQKLVTAVGNTEKVIVVKTRNTVNDIFKLGAILAWLAVAGVCFMYGGILAVIVYIAVFALIGLGVWFFTRPHKDSTLHWSNEKGWHTRDIE